MEAYEIVTHFLTTGKLPGEKEIKIEDYLDNKGYVKIREYYDACMHNESSIDKLSLDELLFITKIDPNIDYKHAFSLFIMYYPEITLPTLKDELFLKEIFSDKNKESIEFANRLIETYLGMIDLQDWFLESNEMVLYRLSQYVKSHESDLLELKENINKIQFKNNTNYSNRKISQLSGFGLDFQKNKLNKLCRILKEKQYIDESTDESSFLFAFTNKNKPQTYKPIIWIRKQNSVNKNQLNKRSLIDLLGELGINTYGGGFIKKTNKLFAKFDNDNIQSIKFTYSNFEYLKLKRKKSEFFTDIQEIVNSL